MSVEELQLPGRGRIRVGDLAGPVGAPVVMLLHGLGATGRLNWAPCIEPLARHFRVVWLDHRGHGSGLRTSQFRLEDCADDSVAVADALGVERFIAVGYSMGGPIASLAWRRHPDVVAGLVLCATARHFTTPRFAQLAGAFLPVASEVARWVPDAVQESLRERMLAARIEHSGIRDAVRDEIREHDPAALIGAARAVSDFSSHEWIGSVDVPTSVVVTTRDQLVPPARQRKLAAAIRDARIFEVDGDHSACASALGSFIPALTLACRDVAGRLASSRDLSVAR